LERLENEESGIVENLSAQKKRQIQPPPPPVAATGPYQAERQQAQAALDAGDSASAADQYRALLQQTDAIDPVIVDLLQATAAHPEASVLHRVLGDAYARKGDSARAAAAYRNAVRHK
jgi:cytochrome c-type biogenesis protein CcmH/NrfG